MTPDDCRRRADDLLRAAAQAANMRERGQLIDEAMRYHNMAQDNGQGARAAEADDGSDPDART